MHKSMLSKTAAAGIAAVLMVGGLGASGQGPAASGPEVYAQEAQVKKKEKGPIFREASVHDPSVIKTGDTYYVFGSHLAAAKSKDLMSWDMVASGVSKGNPLIPNVTEELKETLEWAQSDTLWAADVIQLADGKFYMYYNACKGDSPRSAMGIAVADQIEGPYKDTGIILKSGMWGEISEDGTVYDATKHPNVVDPDVFFDKNGKLWMVYGSYSGGIFIMELDPKTGKPLPGQGYGKKLLGGNHSRIEGPYMLYNPTTDYYYLYLSYGGLDAVGGYNMRVVRSKNPDGPFFDAEGNDMTEVKADPSLPIFDDRSIEPYGVKLMGNYLFKRLIGDPGTGIGTGAVSPGHNSVYYDEQSGRTFLIFHSRFPQRGEEHEIRVHELYMNQDGWPVSAPYRYAGEEAEESKKITPNDAAGGYKLIQHGKDISSVIKESKPVELHKNGKVTGGASGTWKISGKRDVLLTLDGKSYKGVLTLQWDPEAKRQAMTFTALSADGTAVWGARQLDRSDKELVDAVQKDLSLGDVSGVFYDLDLPSEASGGAVIRWSSSHSQVVSAEGKVHRPAAGAGDAKVTLTAQITKGKARTSKTFDVTVLQQSAGPLLLNYPFSENEGGSVSDNSDNGFHGKVLGGVQWNEKSRQGGGMDFGGSDGYIELPNRVADTEDFTFAAWVYWKGGAPWQRVLDVGNGLARHMFLTPSQHSGVLQFTLHGSMGDQSLLAKAPLPSNEWTHVAVTLQGDAGKLYVNGQVVASGDHMKLNPNELLATEAYLGKSRFAADPYFNGSLDEVRIYNVALTESEIKKLAE
ncbi:family 43 glycosylhydrolase [Paenibacillus sp. MDMC362]|uniref:family 43 glycosylhydrolase n=1 Tax=Paenibacillus sp. MDMC362 TaxID=2977365 RepID=UPI000DC3BFC3|nr:LamG-like jellyroll fold domain-containing protein [Paenibacillus sp. MDMC362]RAR42891.1 glycoside hydrolase [Paenibacillus sp. MDMC362]